jgi:hypothetical protein
MMGLMDDFISTALTLGRAGARPRCGNPPHPMSVPTAAVKGSEAAETRPSHGKA